MHFVCSYLFCVARHVGGCTNTGHAQGYEARAGGPEAGLRGLGSMIQGKVETQQVAP